MYMRENNIKDPNVKVGLSPVPVQPPKAPCSKPGQRLDGAKALFDAVNGMNNFTDSPENKGDEGKGCDAEIEKPSQAQPDRSLKQEICNVSDAWFAADPDPTKLSEFCSDKKVKKNFRLLLPGLRSLLMHQASNATIERIFSKLSYLLNKFCKNLNPEVKLCLNFNSRYMKLEGYQHFFKLDSQAGEDVADIETIMGCFYGLVGGAEDETCHG